MRQIVVMLVGGHGVGKTSTVKALSLGSGTRRCLTVPAGEQQYVLVEYSNITVIQIESNMSPTIALPSLLEADKLNKPVILDAYAYSPGWVYALNVLRPRLIAVKYKVSLGESMNRISARAGLALDRQIKHLNGAIGRARLTVKRLHRSGLYIDWIEVNDNHTPEQVAGMINQELVKHVKGLLSANQ